MRSLLSSTWTRIATSYAVLVLITVGVLAFLLAGDFEQREEEALRGRLADQARAVASAAAPIMSGSGADASTNGLAHRMSALFGTRVTLVRLDGVVAGDSEEDPSRMENHASRAEVVQALASPGAVGSSSRLSTTVHRRLLYVAVPVAGANGRLLGVARVAYPLTSVDEARAGLLRSLVLAALLVSLPAALLAVFLARSIVGPLSSLRGVATRVGKGELGARSVLTTGGEIGDLSREFNAMADRLGETIHERTAARNRMAALLANMQDAVIATDQEGRVDLINISAARLFGVHGESAAGRSLIELTRSHELHNALRSALEDDSAYKELEVGFGARTLAAVVTAIPAPEGEQAGALIVLRDVTELRRLERVRRDFVANIGHELRTPLASIKLLVDTLQSAIHEDPAAAEDFLQRIHVELDDLTQLVRELLELSRIESGELHLDLTNVKVSALLERAVGRLRAQAERAGMRLELGDVAGVPDVRADAAKIDQVLVNLLHNAIKFNRAGGSVALGAEERNGEVFLHVSDSGAGIPPEDLPRIFERFYKVDKSRTGGESGTGLGLAIARNIVQAHGGRIWAESTYGSGSTFYFTLPISSPSS